VFDHPEFQAGLKPGELTQPCLTNSREPDARERDAEAGRTPQTDLSPQSTEGVVLPASPSPSSGHKPKMIFVRVDTSKTVVKSCPWSINVGQMFLVIAPSFEVFDRWSSAISQKANYQKKTGAGQFKGRTHNKKYITVERIA
jgi:hypothetical protein